MDGKEGIMKRDCLRTDRLSARCSTCGERTSTTHVPTRASGFYCPGCCPSCAEVPMALHHMGPDEIDRGAREHEINGSDRI